MAKTILVSGVRHQMASIDLRERFALTETDWAPAIQHLMGLEGIEECAILATCNRTEIYVVTSGLEAGMEAIARFYQSVKQVDINQYHRQRFTLVGEDAVCHLFRVASGLDSLIVGEGQILGQVKDTLSFAQTQGSAGAILDKFFKAALSVGKRVRTETGIAEKDVSVSRAAFEMALKQVPDLLSKKIALVGGGKMASILLGRLRQSLENETAKSRITIVNRSTQRLQELIDRFGFTGKSWDDLETVIADADVLFVATGAPHVVLGPRHFENTATPKLVMDISMPRNVDPRVGQLPHINLFNTDDLAQIGDSLGAFSDQSSKETQAELLRQVEGIIAEELVAFQEWLVLLPVIPTITKLREKFTNFCHEHTAQLADENTQPLLESISKGLINKILHEPTIQLKNTEELEHLYSQAHLLERLFNLENSIKSDKSDLKNNSGSQQA